MWTLSENFECFSQILKEQPGEHAIFEHCDRIYRENEKVCETVFACSYGAQIESFKQEKRMVENLSKSKLLKHMKRGPDGLQSQKEGKKFRDTVPFYQ